MNVLKNYSDNSDIQGLLRSSKYTVFVILLLALCTSVDAAEPLGNTSPAIAATDYLKVLLGLAFVIGLFLASSFLLKRFGNGPMLGRGQLRIVDALHLGNRERLMLIELKGKQILLAITPGKINKLDTIEGSSIEEVSSDTASTDVQPSELSPSSMEVTNA